jgi:hypothetical protein
MFRIMAEFVEGFEALADCNPAVSIFGSARVTPEHPDYQKAEAIARQLAREGFAVITGGGPGIMEAANKGAAAAGGRSVGLNIELPMEQSPNPYSNIRVSFRYFVRKVMFVNRRLRDPARRFRHLDELFESITLIRPRRSPFPWSRRRATGRAGRLDRRRDDGGREDLRGPGILRWSTPRMRRRGHQRILLEVIEVAPRALCRGSGRGFPFPRMFILIGQVLCSIWHGPAVDAGAADGVAPTVCFAASRFGWRCVRQHRRQARRDASIPPPAPAVE